MKIDLQVHTFFEKYGLEDVIKTMERNSIDVAALLKYNEDYYDEILKQSKNLPKKFKVEADDLLIRIRFEESVKYFIRGVEIKTDDNFHFVIIGYKGTPKHKTSTETIDDALQSDAFVVFDHPYVSCTNVRKEITRKQEEKLIMLCITYSGKMALEWNSYCKPLIRKILGGIDVNKKTKKLSAQLFSSGFNNPVIADTDLHARNRRLLRALGTSYIETDVNIDSGAELLTSLKNNIINRNYINHENYPSLLHFAEAFGIPILLDSYRNRG